jgi:hypothetical protein
MRARKTDLEILLEYSIPEPNSGCWLWLGYCDDDGYGQWPRLRAGGRRANRIAWEIFGKFVHSSECVCHRCDNPYCVNPGHMFVGSIPDNNEDRKRKGRYSRGAHISTAKLDAESVLRIRALSASLRETAQRFGVSKSLVSAIRRREVWAHV